MASSAVEQKASNGAAAAFPSDRGAWLEPSGAEGPFHTLAACAFPGTADLEESVRRHIGYIDEAADAGADLIVFPEISLHGYPGPMNDRRRMSAFLASAERVPDGPNVKRVLDHAARRDLYVVFGVSELGDRASVLYNTAVLGGPDGYIGRFRKCHVTLREQFIYRHGTDWPVFPTRLGNIGILICYDLHWPEAARELTLRGADIIVAPKAWPGGEMWEAHQLMFETTRAMENSRWLVASNYAGPFNGSHYPGLVRVVDPVGRVVAESGREAGIALATVNLEAAVRDKVAAYTGSLGIIRDRQTASYRALRGEIETVIDA